MHRDLSNDTDPKVESFIIDGYRRMSPAQKIARVTELNRVVQYLALCDMRRRHPIASTREELKRVGSEKLEVEDRSVKFD